MKKIVILIPCLNEEKGISLVLKSVPHKKLKKLGYLAEVVVIDNGSTDKTVEVAKKHKAKVLTEKKKGKGYALRKGFKSLGTKTAFVAMIDGDNTYKLAELPRLIEPVDSGFSNVVIGSRLQGNLKKGSFNLMNKLGDEFTTGIVRTFYRNANITDALSGFVAWDYKSVKKLSPHLVSGGFGIEMEMIAKMDKLGIRMHSVPITYDKRAGDTKIKITDSVKILYTFSRYLFWKP